jgi:hypothetical protein
MDPASPEKSRPDEAMADVPQEPSRGHCCDGLFHRTNVHFWCSAFSSSATTGVRSCTSMWREIPMLFGLCSNCEKHGPTATQILAIRSRRKVWRRCRFGCEGHGEPVDESACNPKPKSLRQAERNPFHVGHNELANYNSQCSLAQLFHSLDVTFRVFGDTYYDKHNSET